MPGKVPIKAEIVGHGGRPASVKRVDIDIRRPQVSGVVALTHRLIEYRASLRPFTNTEYGTAMNQNGLFGGTPILIHDGTDNVAWTATDIAGTKMTADSTDQAFTGTKSVKVDNPNLSDVWQFDNGGPQALAAYTALSMHIYVDKDWDSTASVQLYGWDGSSEVGTRVNLEDYFAFGEFDVWHSLAIPFGDMGLTGETVTGFRMQQTARNGKAAKFYIDVFQIEETGAPILFTAIPSAPERRYHATHLTITIADALPGTLVSGTMPALSYDKILGVANLANGIVLSHIINGEVSLQAPFSGLLDFLSIGFKIENAVSDGTNTAIVIQQTFNEPLVMYGTAEDNFIGVTIQDDMTGLLRFTAVLRGYEDLIQP